MKYKYLFFDLDGTIIDSLESVKQCLISVMNKYSIVIPEAEFRTFVGPPLTTSFRRLFSTEKEIKQAVGEFEQVYYKSGINLSPLFDGIKETLLELNNRDYKLFLATSKQEDAAKKILEAHGILNYFEEIFGANRGSGVIEKEDVLKNAFRMIQPEKSQCVMIGDTKYDAIGAKFIGIDCIFCKYGCGVREDIETNNIVYEAYSPKDLLNFLPKPL